MFFKIAVYKTRKFHKKTPLLESLHNKVAGPTGLIKKRFRHRRFPAEFANFLKLQQQIFREVAVT